MRSDVRPKWKRAVFARYPAFEKVDAETGEVESVPAMSDSCRVLLLRLLDEMNALGTVSIPRSRLAKDLGVPPARIAERVKLARAHGLLESVRQGYPGSTAVYRASFPSWERGTSDVPLGVRQPGCISVTRDVPLAGSVSPPMPDLEVRMTDPHCRETPASGVQVDVDQLRDETRAEEDRRRTA